MRFRKFFVWSTLCLLLGANLALFAAEAEVEIQVDGLSCPFCVWGLKKKLGEVQELKRIEVDYKKGLVRAKWEEGTPYNEERIKKAVREAGFTAREISFHPTTQD